MIQELEPVALTVGITEHHLKAGDMGTVVDITSDGQEYTMHSADPPHDSSATAGCVRCDRTPNVPQWTSAPSSDPAAPIKNSA